MQFIHSNDFQRVQLERFQNEDFLRHAGELVKRISDAAGTHVGRFVALVGVVCVREFDAYRHIIRKVFQQLA